MPNSTESGVTRSKMEMSKWQRPEGTRISTGPFVTISSDSSVKGKKKKKKKKDWNSNVEEKKEEIRSVSRETLRRNVIKLDKIAGMKPFRHAYSNDFDALGRKWLPTFITFLVSYYSISIYIYKVWHLALHVWNNPSKGVPFMGSSLSIDYIFVVKTKRKRSTETQPDGIFLRFQPDGSCS